MSERNVNAAPAQRDTSTIPAESTADDRLPDDRTSNGRHPGDPHDRTPDPDDRVLVGRSPDVDGTSPDAPTEASSSPTEASAEDELTDEELAVHPDDRRTDDSRTDDRRTDDSRTDDRRTDDPRTYESPAESRADDPRPDELGDGELDERERPAVGGAPVADQSTMEIPETGASTVSNASIVDSPAETGTAAGLWAASDADALRERWREIQLRFVDDPRSAASAAAGLVDEAAGMLIAAIEARRAELSQFSVPTTDERTSAEHADAAQDARDNGSETEHLRRAVQHYREFLDRVLTL